MSKRLSTKKEVLEKKSNEFLTALHDLEELQTELGEIEGATLTANQSGANCLSIISEIHSVKELVQKRSTQLYDPNYYLSNISHVIFLQRWMRKVVFRSRLLRGIRDLLAKAKAGEIETTPSYQQIVALQELFVDEKDFLFKLIKLRDMFIIPFEEVAFPNDLKELLKRFSGILFEILRFGWIFCDGLQKIIKSLEPAKTEFPKLVAGIKDSFEVTMLPYVQIHDQFVDKVEQYRTTKGDTKFNEFFDNTEKRAGVTSMRSLTVCPLQRIPKYMGFTRTLTSLGLCEEDVAPMEMLEMVKFMNAGSLSGSQKLIDLTMEIDFPHLGLVEPGRTLIHSGNLYKCWQARDWRKWSLMVKAGQTDTSEKKEWAPAPLQERQTFGEKLFFILTNDLLIFCSTRRGFGPKYHYISFFNILPSSTILKEPRETIPDFPHCIELSMGEKGFILGCENAEEKKIWLEKFEQAVEIQTEKLVEGSMSFPAADGLRLVKQAGLVMRKDRIFWTSYLMKFKGNSFFFFEDQGDYTNFVDVIPNVLRFSVRCAEKSLNRKFSVEFYCKGEKSVYFAFSDAPELGRWLYVWKKSLVNVDMTCFPQYAQSEFEDTGIEDILKGKLIGLKEKLQKERGILVSKGIERSLEAWGEKNPYITAPASSPAGPTKTEYSPLISSRSLSSPLATKKKRNEERDSKKGDS